MNIQLQITFLGIILGFHSEPLLAVTEAPQIFCEVYQDAPACKAAAFSCDYCHTGAPNLNPFGLDIQTELGQGDLRSQFMAAFQTIKDRDSDVDSIPNQLEIESGSFPGDPTSTPSKTMPLTYDTSTAFKRIKTVYCGQPATFEEIEALASSADPKGFLHAELDQCLASDYWIKEALHRMADPKIRPVYAVGAEGPVVIGDYSWDYQLYAYIMSGNRDTRELLTAQYHVDANGQKLEGQVPRGNLTFQLGAERIIIAGGQPLVPERRAGMITTQWFLSVNTMFAILPRTTAAQAYRAYLGLDLALGQGLFPADGEPRDVDNKNVAQPACAVCHETLDSISYPFSTYRGIDVGIDLFFGNPIGTYNGGRTPWEAEGTFMGESVTDLLDWAKKAANTDAFKKNIVKDIFIQALGRAPRSEEIKEFELLWQSMPADGYSANKLIHRFVDTLAFGGI